MRNITAGERDWQIAFLDGTDSLAGDENFMEALKLCILVQKQREEKGGLSGFWNEKNRMKQPVVFYVEGPYTQTADELAEKTYDDEDSLLLYASVIDEVSPRTAKNWENGHMRRMMRHIFLLRRTPCRKTTGWLLQ